MKFISNTKTMKKGIKEKPLTGVDYEIANPSDGADINAENISHGFHLKLKTGETVTCDETIAKNAKFVWNFLKISPISPTSPTSPTNVKKVMPVKEEVNEEEDEAFPEDAALNVDKYTFNEMRKIAHALKIEKVNKLNKDNLKAKLFNYNLNSIKPIIEGIKLPLYIIK